MSWKKFFSEVPVAGASDGTYSAMGGGITGKPGPEIGRASCRERV